MTVRVSAAVDVWEIEPSREGSSWEPGGSPASVRRATAAPERKRNPERRRWWVQTLKPDGSVHFERWVDPGAFGRFYYATELEAWEGLLAWAKENAEHHRKRAAFAAQEAAELEQQVRFKRWRAAQEGTER